MNTDWINRVQLVEGRIWYFSTSVISLAFSWSLKIYLEWLGNVASVFVIQQFPRCKHSSVYYRIGKIFCSSGKKILLCRDSEFIFKNMIDWQINTETPFFRELILKARVSWLESPASNQRMVVSFPLFLSSLNAGRSRTREVFLSLRFKTPIK